MLKSVVEQDTVRAAPMPASQEAQVLDEALVTAEEAALAKSLRQKIATVRAKVIRLGLRTYRRLPISTRVRDRISRFAARLAPGTYRHVVAIGGPLHVKRQPPRSDGPQWLADVVDNPRFRLGFWQLTHTLRDHVARHGPVTHLIALPFLARGGAEAAALNFSRAATEACNGSALLVATENRLPNAARFEAPVQVLELDLSDYFPGADPEEREALLLGVLRIAGPAVFHIINSGIGWNLLIKAPDRVRPVARTFASIFAFQFDPNGGQKVGYAADFLPAAMPHLDGLISDNQRFIHDACSELALRDACSRMHVAYNPVRDVGEDTFDSARVRIASIADRIGQAPRLQVIWASRLDAEKRIDLLPAIARLCPQMDFHIHGSRVVDEKRNKVNFRLPNVRLHGAFSDAREVVARQDAHVFIFTSRWEGLPNVLLEFGALGIPIIAPTVGGIGELIDSTTGYPLGEQATAEDYSRALQELMANPDDARTRAALLLDRIEERHSVKAFKATLRSTPGYLPRGAIA